MPTKSFHVCIIQRGYDMQYEMKGRSFDPEQVPPPLRLVDLPTEEVAIDWVDQNVNVRITTKKEADETIEEYRRTSHTKKHDYNIYITVSEDGGKTHKILHRITKGTKWPPQK